MIIMYLDLHMLDSYYEINECVIQFVVFGRDSEHYLNLSVLHS